MRRFAFWSIALLLSGGFVVATVAVGVFMGREEIERLDSVRKRPVSGPADPSFPLVILVPSEEAGAPEAHLVLHEDLDTFREEHGGETFLIPAGSEDAVREQLRRRTFAHTADPRDPMEIGLRVVPLGPERQRIELRVRHDNQYRNDSWYEATEDDFVPLFERRYKVPLGLVIDAQKRAFLIGFPTWAAFVVLLGVFARKRRRTHEKAARAGGFQ